MEQASPEPDRRSERSSPSLPSAELLRLVEDLNFCSSSDFASIVAVYADQPKFFSHLQRVLEGRNGDRVGSSSEFYFTVAFDNPALVTAALERTIHLSDQPRVFEDVWRILKESKVLSGRKQYNIPTTEREDLIDRATRVVQGFRPYKPQEYFPAMHWRSIEVVLEQSRFPDEDLRLFRSSQENPPKVEELNRYYNDGYAFITSAYHPDYFEIPSHVSLKKRVDLGELSILGTIARAPSLSSVKVARSLAHFIYKQDSDLRTPLMDILHGYIDGEYPLSYFQAVVSQLQRCDHASQDITHCLQQLSQVEPSQIVAASMLLEELLASSHGSFSWLSKRYSVENIPKLEEQLYRHRLEEHAKKFPEKSLAEVREAFLTPDHIDSEVIDESRLDRALAMYQKIVEIGEVLKAKSRTEVSVSIQELLASDLVTEDPQAFKVQFFAHTRSLFKNYFGVYPYNTQMLTLLLLTDEQALEGEEGEQLKGAYAQVKTGEGKTLILALLASYRAAHGQNVDVISSNSYLAQRDASMLRGFFQSMGLTSSAYNLYEEQKGKEGLHPVSRAPRILYSTNHSMIFAYLSSLINGRPFFGDERFATVIVDEADNLCIDLSSESCRLSMESSPTFSDETMRGFIKYVDDFGSAEILKDIELATSTFIERYEEARQVDPIIVSLYLRSAVRSRSVELGVDYIIRDGEIKIVDVANTGRVKEKTQWDCGLHEFVTLRNDLTLPSAYGLSAQMSHPTFIDRYQEVFCISGTMGDSIDRAEIREIYSLSGFDVPSHHLSKREDGPLTVFSSHKAMIRYLDRCATDTVTGAEPRALLIVAATIKESEELYNYFREQYPERNVQLLNDNSNINAEGNIDAEENIIRLAGEVGTMTIATSVAGRGADIIPDKEVAAHGGLAVIITFIPENLRVEFQARGRAGRQGAPGSSEVISNIKRDRWISTLPGFARKAISKTAKEYGPASEEVNRIVGFVRKAMNIIYSYRRKTAINKDTILQEAMSSYLSQVQLTRDILEEHNDVFRKNKMHGLASSALSIYMQDQWAREFDLFDKTLTHWEEKEDVAFDEDSPSVTELLEDAYEQTFSHRQADTESESSELLESLMERFLRLAEFEDRAGRQLNLHTAREALERISDRITTMTRDALEELTDMDDASIRDLLGPKKDEEDQDTK